MGVLDRVTVRPGARPGVVVGGLLATIGLAVLSATLVDYWPLVLLVPLAFVVSRWGYGDPFQRALLGTALMAAAVVILGLLPW